VDQGGVAGSKDGRKLHSEATQVFTASGGLQLLYETAPVGLAFLSTDCRYLMINQHLTEICGISVADHIGRSVRETVPQVAEQVERIVDAIVSSGAPITGIEINGQRPDGSNVDRVWITHWYPLKVKNGSVIGINVAAEEITERKRAEADRARIQEQLQLLNETLVARVEAEAQERDRLWRLSDDLLVVTDTVGVIRNVNPAWTVTLGWTADDLIGKTGEWLIHSDDRERSQEELARLQKGRPSSHFENRILCKDASYRWLSWRAIVDQARIYAIARDITGLKEAEEQLYNLRDELARVSRQTTIGAMTASIAHEIRQPLASIAANASAGLRWLERAEPNLAETQAALTRVIQETHRVDEVIASIRTMFGRKAGQRTRVNIRSLINDVIVLTQRELTACHVTQRNVLQNDLPDVEADRVQIQQVLTNLIMNSLDAMQEIPGRVRTLAITSDFDDAKVTLTIADNGKGLDPEQHHRIFDPFFTTKSNGMGLGLSICRSIIEAHGGRIWASPNSPHGAAFHLSLPLPKKGE
jgi:PAS domain S-box-containing protein